MSPSCGSKREFRTLVLCEPHTGLGRARRGPRSRGVGRSGPHVATERGFGAKPHLRRGEVPDDRPHCLVRSVAAVPRHHDDAGAGRLGRPVVPEPADRRLPGPVAAARGDRHAVARPRGRGDGAADHHPDRARDERHPEARGAPVDLALRAVVGGDELPVRRRPVLRARAGVRARAERRGARRRQPRHLAALQPERAGLPLRAPEPRPLAPGSEDDRGLGGRAPLPRDPGRGGRLGLRRHHDAVPGAARPAAAAVVRRLDPAGRGPARREQRERGRGLLLAGRAVLLRPRPGPRPQPRRHRQRRAGGAQRDSRARARRGQGGDRPRGAPRPVRLHEAERGRRRRHPAARRRAGPGGAEARAAGHEEPERARAAARREGGAVLRPLRPHRRDDEDRGAQPAPGHAARAGRAGAAALQRPHGAHRGRHDPLLAALRVHLPRLGEHSGQPAVDRRDRLRHHRRRVGRDGGEHLPRAGRAARAGLQRHRRDPRRRARRRAAHLLRGGRDHRRLPAHLRAVGAVGPAVPPDGRHDGVRARRRAAVRADAAARAVRLVPAQGREGAERRALRGRAAPLRPPAERGARLPQDHRGVLPGGVRRLAAARAVHRRGVHAAPRRGRAVGARHDALHHLVRRGVGARAEDPRRPARLSAGHRRRERARAAGRRHRPDRVLQRRVLRGAQAVRRPGVAGRHPDQAAAHRRGPEEALGVPWRDLQLHAAGRGRRGRGRDGPQERAGGEDLRPRPPDARAEGRRREAGDREGAGHHRHHRRPRAGPAEPDRRAEPREARALRHERVGHQRRAGDRRRRHRRDPGHPGRAAVRPRRPDAGAVPQGHGVDQAAARGDARRPAAAAQRVRRHQGEQGRVVHLPGVELALHRHPVQRAGTRPGQRRRPGEGGRGERGAAADRLLRTTGAGSTRTTWRRARS